MVASGCSTHPTVDTVYILANKKTERKVKAGMRSRNKVKTTAKSKEKNRQDKVKAVNIIKVETVDTT